MESQVRSFAAASRKRNIIAFGLLAGNLDWIEDNPTIPGVYPVPFATAPIFDAVNGLYQMMTVTADFAPVFRYAGSATGTVGAQMVLRFEMSGGPWLASWPSNFNVEPGYQLSDTVTIFTVWWNGDAWEMSTPPVVNPA